MLGLTFDNESDYDLIKEMTHLTFTDLTDFGVGKQLNF